MKVLLTGATGFVGKAVLATLSQQHFTPVLALRTEVAEFNQYQTFIHPSIDEHTQWQESLAGCETVIHSAARVHIMAEDSSQALEKFRAVNTAGTINLARQAAQAGVKRFIFISTIKVLGEQSCEQPFSYRDPAQPADNYAVSKFEAEQALLDIAKNSDLEVVIIRPVLVYGPGVKANFLTMLKWLDKSIPLPLGAIANKRSFISLDNLADLITLCVTHPNAANQVFLASDDCDLSTTQLLQSLKSALNSRALLIPIPMSWLTMLAKILGKANYAQRLCGSLHVDITHTKQSLDWTPPVSVEQGIAKTVAAFQEEFK